MLRNILSIDLERLVTRSRPSLNSRPQTSAMIRFVAGFAVASFSMHAAQGQSFSDLPLPPAIANASDACTDALNTTLSCPAFLARISVEYVMGIASKDVRIVEDHGLTKYSATLHSALTT